MPSKGPKHKAKKASARVLCFNCGEEFQTKDGLHVHGGSYHSFWIHRHCAMLMARMLINGMYDKYANEPPPEELSGMTVQALWEAIEAFEVLSE